MAKCVSFCKEKQIAFSKVILRDKEAMFTSNDKNLKLNIHKGKELKFNIMKKTNLDFTLKYSELKNIDDFLSKMVSAIV